MARRTMDPARMRELIELCFAERRRNGERPKLKEVADYFEVTPVTLRRWMTGETPIPRAVELVFETNAKRRNGQEAT